MSDVSQRIAALSPAQRDVLERRLRGIKPLADDGGLSPHKKDERVFCLSSCQERLWFEHHLHADTPIYTEAIILDITGPLDHRVLENSYTELVRRHEILRTCFKHVDGELRQIVCDATEVIIPVLDLRRDSVEEQTAKTRQESQAEARRRFELDQLPLFRCVLFWLGDKKTQLVFSGHHITIDGWSIGLFFQELFQTYAALADGQQTGLPEPGIQYADYAVWQQSWLETKAARAQLNFWKNRLQGRLGELGLPTDRPRSPVRSTAGAREAFSVTAELSNALRELSKRKGVTLFMLLLAAFKALLYRYTRQSQITVGSPNANRDRRELEEVIGPFINMFALSTNVGAGQTFDELLESIRSTTLEAYANREFPFEKLVAELQPDRDMSRTPLFQVMFDLQRLPTPMNPPGLSVAFVESDSGIAKFDLSLLLRETDQGIIGGWEYSTQLFERDTIVRMQRHYLVLLDSVMGDSSQRVSSLPILTEEENLRILREWNDTAAEWADGAWTPQLFESAATEWSDRVAAVSEHDELTYGELDSKSNVLATRLKQLGVGPDVVVGLCLERGLDLLTAMLAVLKAGGCYLPLDGDYPRERLAFMVDDSGAAIVLTHQSLEGALSGCRARLLCLDGYWDGPLSEGPSEPMPPADGDGLAYIIYTSGSTGKPKGVQITHQALSNFLQFMRLKLGLDGSDTVLALTSLSFDISSLELLLPLICGSRVAIVDRETAYDSEKLTSAIGQFDITVMQATPTLWIHLTQSGWAGRPGLKVLCGGEPMSRDLAERLLGLGESVCNLYGPTETTVWSSTCDVAPEAGPVSIGRPIANTQMFVLDSDLNLMPGGIPGDLHIAGWGLARGYANRPDLTAEKFTPNPFSSAPGERLYKTGDLVRFKVDGEIEFLGRDDYQVKVRGFRIEPEEIESVLAAHPSVGRCAVVGKPDGNGVNRLVAYISGLNGQTSSDFREYVKERLPDYMVPSVYVFSGHLPLTSNGKVDRKALAQRDMPASVVEETIPPDTDTERKLAEVWGRLLGAAEVGIDDNFFYLGGYSLLASSMASEIRNAFGVNMPLAKAFERPTIRGLSEWIDSQLQVGRIADVLPQFVTPIQTSGARPPVFFVPPGSGSPNCYVDLAVHLGSDQPVYGFLSPGLLKRGATPSSIERMADLYIEQMQKIQPIGPYVLAGWSFGAFVAFEMGRLLEQRGEEVSLVALIDAAPPASQGRPVWKSPGFVIRFGATIVKTLMGPKLPRSYREMKLLAKWMGIDLPDSFRSIRDRDIRAQFKFLAVLVSNLLGSLSVFKATLLSFLKYVPRDYGGRVVVFGGSEDLKKRRAMDDGVRQLVSGTVETRIATGNHMTILDPAHAEALASELSDSITAAAKADRAAASLNKRRLQSNNRP